MSDTKSTLTLAIISERKKHLKTFREIAKEMDERNVVQVPEGYVTGDEFEKWLRKQTQDKENEE